MRKDVLCLAVLMLFAGVAGATTTFSVSNVTFDGPTDPDGLHLEFGPATFPIEFDLEPGDCSDRFSVGTLWTTENQVDDGSQYADDQTPVGVSAEVFFTSPEVTSGILTGLVVGELTQTTEGWSLTWDGPTQVVAGNCVFSIELFDASVATTGNMAGITDTLEAQVCLESCGEPVPEPASMTLLGLGLAGLGFRRFRKRG